MLEAQGKLSEALDDYSQSLKIRQFLAEQDPSNAGWQRDLSVGYEKVGGVLEAQGKLSEALDDYRQSLKIRQFLAKQDPSNVGWQRDLILSYYRIGQCMAKSGNNSEQAQKLLRMGLDLAGSYPGVDRESLIEALYEAIGRSP